MDIGFLTEISQRFSVLLETHFQADIFYSVTQITPHPPHPHLFSAMWMLCGRDVNGALRDGFSSSCGGPWWDYTFMETFFFKWSLVMTTLCMSFHTFLSSKQYWRTLGFNFPGSSRAKCQGPQVTQTDVRRPAGCREARFEGFECSLNDVRHRSHHYMMVCNG